MKNRNSIKERMSSSATAKSNYSNHQKQTNKETETDRQQKNRNKIVFCLKFDMALTVDRIPYNHGENNLENKLKYLKFLPFSIVQFRNLSGFRMKARRSEGCLNLTVSHPLIQEYISIHQKPKPHTFPNTNTRTTKYKNVVEKLNNNFIN